MAIINPEDITWTSGESDQRYVNGYNDARKKYEARVRELEAEVAALKKAIEIDECGREIIEAKNKEIADKDAALAAAAFSRFSSAASYAASVL